MRRKRLFLIFLSLGLSLLLAEYILGKYFPQKTYSYLYKNSINCFAKSETTVFTLKPNCTINFTDYDAKENFTTKTNSLGYRGDDFTLKKKPGEKRVLLAGDSFILGFGVKDENLVSSILRDKLKTLGNNDSLYKTLTINAGYAGGFGPDGYFLHLKTQGIKLEPDLVIFSVFVYNDFSDLGNSEWIGWGKYGEPVKIVSKTTMVDDRGHLIPKNTPLVYRIPVVRDSHVAILTADNIKKTGEFINYLFGRIRFKIKPPVLPTGEVSDTNLLGPHTNVCIFADLCHRKTMHLFTDFLSVAKAGKELTERIHKDGKNHFAVLIIPADFQLYPDALKKYNDSGLPLDAAKIKDPYPQKRIKEMLDKEKISYIDLLPAFRESGDRLYFKDDGHWNKLGHQAAAEEIFRWIRENYR